MTSINTDDRIQILEQLAGDLRLSAEQTMQFLLSWLNRPSDSNNKAIDKIRSLMVIENNRRIFISLGGLEKLLASLQSQYNQEVHESTLKTLSLLALDKGIPAQLAHLKVHETLYTFIVAPENISQCITYAALDLCAAFTLDPNTKDILYSEKNDIMIYIINHAKSQNQMIQMAAAKVMTNLIQNNSFRKLLEKLSKKNNSGISIIIKLLSSTNEKVLSAAVGFFWNFSSKQLTSKEKKRILHGKNTVIDRLLMLLKTTNEDLKKKVIATIVNLLNQNNRDGNVYNPIYQGFTKENLENLAGCTDVTHHPELSLHACRLMASLQPVSSKLKGLQSTKKGASKDILNFDPQVIRNWDVNAPLRMTLSEDNIADLVSTLDSSESTIQSQTIGVWLCANISNNDIYPDKNYSSILHKKGVLKQLSKLISSPNPVIRPLALVGFNNLLYSLSEEEKQKSLPMIDAFSLIHLTQNNMDPITQGHALQALSFLGVNDVIEFAVKTLEKGTKMTKLSNGKANERNFHLNLENKTLEWKSRKSLFTGRKVSSSPVPGQLDAATANDGDKPQIHLRNIKEIKVGHSSKANEKYFKKNENSREYMFTIMYGEKGEKSLEMVCKNRRELDAWLLALYSEIAKAKEEQPAWLVDEVREPYLKLQEALKSLRQREDKMFSLIDSQYHSIKSNLLLDNRKAATEATQQKMVYEIQLDEISRAIPELQVIAAQLQSAAENQRSSSTHIPIFNESNTSEKLIKRINDLKNIGMTISSNSMDPSQLDKEMAEIGSGRVSSTVRVKSIKSSQEKEILGANSTTSLFSGEAFLVPPSARSEGKTTSDSPYSMTNNEYFVDPEDSSETNNILYPYAVSAPSHEPEQEENKKEITTTTSDRVSATAPGLTVRSPSVRNTEAFNPAPEISPEIVEQQKRRMKELKREAAAKKAKEEEENQVKLEMFPDVKIQNNEFNFDEVEDVSNSQVYSRNTAELI